MKYQTFTFNNSLSLDELYGLLCSTVRDMSIVSDGKNHQLFLDKKDKLDIIRSIIEEKKQLEKSELI